MVWCKACRHRAEAPLQMLVDTGRGNVPLVRDHAGACPLGFANVGIQLRLTPRQDLGSVITGRATLSDVALHRADGGFDIIAGRCGSGCCWRSSRRRWSRRSPPWAARRHVTAQYSWTSARASIARCGGCLPGPIRSWCSRPAAYAVRKLHVADRPRGERRGQSGRHTQAGERTFATLERACRRAPLLAGIVRRADRVRDAIRRQALPLSRHPASPAGADVEAIAASL